MQKKKKKNSGSCNDNGAYREIILILLIGNKRVIVYDNFLPHFFPFFFFGLKKFVTFNSCWDCCEWSELFKGVNPRVSMSLLSSFSWKKTGNLQRRKRVIRAPGQESISNKDRLYLIERTHFVPLTWMRFQHMPEFFPVPKSTVDLILQIAAARCRD